MNENTMYKTSILRANGSVAEITSVERPDVYEFGPRMVRLMYKVNGYAVARYLPTNVEIDIRRQEDADA